MVTLALAARAVADVDGPLRIVRVRGGDYRGARETARTAEDIWHQLQRLSGFENVPSQKPLFHFDLRKEPPAGVTLIPGPAPDYVPFQFVIRGDSGRVEEELAEQMARVVLWIQAGCGGDPARPLADWLAVGLAQNLSPYRRVRNRILTWEWAVQGDLPTVRDILYWIRMPTGPMSEKAVCGQWVAWVLSEPGGGERLRTMVRTTGGGAELSAARAYEILTEGRTNDLEESWRTWALRREGVPSGGLPLTPFLIRQLRASVGVPPSDLALGSLLGEDPLSPAQVLALRDHPLLRQAVQNRTQALSLAVLGAPKELADLILGYQQVYRQMTGLTPSFLLKRRIRVLDGQMARLEDRTTALRDWLDEWDTDIFAEEIGLPSGESE